MDGGAKMLTLVGGADLVEGLIVKMLLGATLAAGGNVGVEDGEATDMDASVMLPERERLRVRGRRGGKMPRGRPKPGAVSRGGREGARGGVDSVEDGGKSSLEASLAPRLCPWYSYKDAAEVAVSSRSV